MKRVFVKEKTVISLSTREPKKAVVFGDVIESELDLSKSGFVKQEYLKEYVENKIRNEKVLMQSAKETIEKNIEKTKKQAEDLISQMEKKLSEISKNKEIEKFEKLISEETEEEKPKKKK